MNPEGRHEPPQSDCTSLSRAPLARLRIGCACGLTCRRDRDADSNLFIGHRIGIAADGAGTVVRGNYFHLLMPLSKEYPYWSQVSVFTTGPEVIGEYNVIRDGEWIVRFVEGEFRSGGSGRTDTVARSVRGRRTDS